MGAQMAVHRVAVLLGELRQRRADRVIVVRQQAPKYLVGFKSSGAAVFGYDVKLAKKFEAGCTELGEALGALRGLEEVEVVVPEKTRAASA
jgi:hypothetical protein